MVGSATSDDKDDESTVTSDQQAGEERLDPICR